MSNLEKVLIEDGPVLSGKKVGLNARKTYALDTFDASNSHVEVEFTSAETVTSSFILGFFSPSVQHLGEKGFWEKYEIAADPYVLENIRSNVRFAALKGTALS